MHKLLLLTLLIPFVTVGQSSKGSLYGSVSNQDGEPLPWATVLLENTRYGVQTDENGNYRISNIPNGDYVVTVSYVGFKTLSDKISITKKRKDIQMDFTLEENAEHLDEVTVSGKSKETKHVVCVPSRRPRLHDG